jgi:glycosyltransferase involved in cell wall biosynthesis
MKIDLVITELDVGGAEQCLTNLALHLKRSDHDLRVIVLGPPPVHEVARLQHRLAEGGVELHFLGGRQWWEAPRVWLRLWSLVRVRPPALAQAFLFHANLLASLVYPVFRIPLVGGIRVTDPRRSRIWLTKLSSSLMEKVVCVSQAVADTCNRREGIPFDKLVVIHNGIECSDGQASPGDSPQAGSCRGDSCYAQNQLGLPVQTPCLLFVGRLEHQKGVDVLMEQSNLFLEQLPEHHLIILGDGPLKVSMQTFASLSRFEERIHFAGQRDDVMEWMRSSQLLLLPTRYEGMPNVVMEAMVCGLPVMTTRAEGILELLGEAAVEQTVAVGDWNAWRRGVVELAGNPARLSKLSQENRDRCGRYFELAEKMAQYEELYLSILQRKTS